MPGATASPPTACCFTGSATSIRKSRTCPSFFHPNEIIYCSCVSIHRLLPPLAVSVKPTNGDDSGHDHEKPKSNHGANGALRFRYSPTDFVRVANMVCYDHGGTAKLLPMVQYCESHGVCRKTLLAARFGETVHASDCAAMCDACAPPVLGKQPDVCQTAHVDWSLDATNLCFFPRLFSAFTLDPDLSHGNLFMPD